MLANASYTVTGHRRDLLYITCSVTGNSYELLAIASYSVTGHRRALLTTTSGVIKQLRSHANAAGSRAGAKLVGVVAYKWSRAFDL